MSLVTLHLSPVACHLSLTSRAIATDPTPDSYPTIHRRLVQQERTSKLKKINTQKTIKIFQKNKCVLSFPILMMCSSTRSLQSTQLHEVSNDTDTHPNRQTGNATYRLNRPRRRFSGLNNTFTKTLWGKLYLCHTRAEKSCKHPDLGNWILLKPQEYLNQIIKLFWHTLLSSYLHGNILFGGMDSIWGTLPTENNYIWRTHHGTELRHLTAALNYRTLWHLIMALN